MKNRFERRIDEMEVVGFIERVCFVMDFDYWRFGGVVELEKDGVELRVFSG